MKIKIVNYVDAHEDYFLVDTQNISHITVEVHGNDCQYVTVILHLYNKELYYVKPFPHDDLMIRIREVEQIKECKNIVERNKCRNMDCLDSTKNYAEKEFDEAEYKKLCQQHINRVYLWAEKLQGLISQDPNPTIVVDKDIINK